MTLQYARVSESHLSGGRSKMERSRRIGRSIQELRTLRTTSQLTPSRNEWGRLETRERKTDRITEIDSIGRNFGGTSRRRFVVNDRSVLPSRRDSIERQSLIQRKHPTTYSVNRTTRRSLRRRTDLRRVSSFSAPSNSSIRLPHLSSFSNQAKYRTNANPSRA